jgi:hypothetical protein
MAFTFKLRPVAGTVPWDEIDISARVGPYESEPKDYDARSRSITGRLTRVVRGMGRQFVFPEIVNLTDAEVDILRRWKMNRVRLSISPNWNETTLLYARYNRFNPYTGLLESVYGTDPTFTRTIASTNASTTQRRADGKYDLLAANIPRIEPSNVSNAFAPAAGLRPFGKHKNYFGQSHPKSSATMWTLTNASGLASYQWDGAMPRMVLDSFPTGAGRFIGRANPDFITAVVASYDAASIISVGVWVMGEGTVRMVLSGGATSTGSDLVLSPNTWQLLKLEGITASGASVNVKIEARVTATWCAVGPAQFNASRRLLGYVHNVANTSVYQVGNDDLYYDLQLPNFATTIHVGLEMPDLVSGGEQCALGVDQGSGNRLVLRYRADTNKFSFQKTAVGSAVAEWTPLKAAGQGTIISICAEKNNYRVYENGTQVASVGTGLVEPIARALHVGWDGVTGNEDEAWNGLIYFIRVDSAALDAPEIAYVSLLWNDSQGLNITRACEGRIFEIATPVHRMPLGMNRSSLELEQVDSIYSATHEVP